MKFWALTSAVVLTQLIAFAPAIAESEDGLPDTGTYFILNALNEQAMQPAGLTAGQNVLLYEYNKGGTQKWTVTRKVDPVTHKPTNKYNVKLAGDSTQLYLQPHPITTATAILGGDPTVYIMQPETDGVVVRSVERNGDAMFIVSSPPMNPEVHFGPKDESSKFRWKFVKAEW
jgi:hypothetical protein